MSIDLKFSCFRNFFFFFGLVLSDSSLKYATACGSDHFEL